MFMNRWHTLHKHLEGCEYTTQKEKITSDEALQMMRFLLSQAKKQQGIVYLIGNGGSAGIASHFSTDFLRTLNLPSSTLTDPCSVTCFANDCGYDQAFSIPLEKKIRSEDLVIAISSSGKSANILNAGQVALKKHVPLVTFTGFSSENPLREMGSLNFWVDSQDYGIVETLHFFLLHAIVDLFGQPSHGHPNKQDLAHAR